MDLSSLVTLQTDVVPYVLDWSSPHEAVEAAVFVINVRPGGLLLAVPLGVVPEEVLARGNEPLPPGHVGPSTVVVVPAVLPEGGVLSPTGSSMSVLVVDMSEEVVGLLHPVEPSAPVEYAFDAEQPFAIPDPAFLKARVRDWLEAGGETSGLGYATAEPELDGEVMEEEEAPVTPQVSRQRRPTQRGREPASASGKKPTVAVLASSIDQLLQANVGISKQLESLALRQQQLERDSHQS